MEIGVVDIVVAVEVSLIQKRTVYEVAITYRTEVGRQGVKVRVSMRLT